MTELHEKILFVEDDPGDQLAVKRLAAEEDFLYDADIAGTLKEAKELLQREEYNLVVLDYMLHDGTAFDLFAHIRGIPIIIVTGIGDEEIAVRAMKAGAYDYMVKDSEGSYLKTLPVTIENVLKRHRTEMELTRYREHLELLVRVRTEDLRREIEERKKAEEQAMKSLREKEHLIREVHHRVKNNMQIVSSILNMQASELGTTPGREAEILKRGEGRIQSMALVHDSLYESEDLSRVDFKLYIGTLLNHIRDSFGIDEQTIAMEIDVEDVPLSINMAIPCAQIINELVTNSIRYAFPDGRKGRIVVSLKKHEQGYRLTVADNGVGIRNSENGEYSPSLGLQLAEALTVQLKGAIELNRDQGTAFTIDFSGISFSPEKQYSFKLSVNPFGKPFDNKKRPGSVSGYW